MSNLKTLIGILLLMGCVLAYSFGLSPLIDEVSANDTQLQELKSEITIYNDQKEMLAGAEAEFDLTTEVKRRESLGAIPAELQQDDVLKELVGFASDNEIDLNAISFANGASAIEEIGMLRVNASFEGNYNDLKDFLRSLETAKRLYSVANISVQLNELKITGLKRANFSLTIETFYQL
jgi:Tfp pilus assembly protein PilO